MTAPNFLLVFPIALIPLVIGFLWYSKMMFGNAWMKAAKITIDEGKTPKMWGILIAAYIFSILICASLYSMVIHQMGVYSTLANEPGLTDPSTPMGAYFADFMTRFGHNFRTFKHGALHGVLAAIFLAMPIIGTSAVFESKGFKYIIIHTGYWIVTLALVGGCICQFA